MVYSFFLQLDLTQPQSQVPVWGDTWSLFLIVFKMCITLGGVCVLAFVVLRYGLPRLTGMKVQQGKLMNIVARFPLDAQKSLYVIEVAGKHMLIGVTEQRIEMLSELESESIHEALERAAEDERDSPMRLGSGAVKGAVKEFSRYLRR